MPDAPSSSHKLAHVLAIIAIAAGLMAVAVGAIKGRRAGYEMMMMYSAPSLLAAIAGIAIHRSKLTWAGVGGGVLAIVGAALGS